MKFEEIEALYYQFTLKNGFIPKSIMVSKQDTLMSLRYATRQLCDFINEDMIIPNVPHHDKKATCDVEHDSITFITAKKEEYDTVKGFMNYLINSGKLLKLVKDCFVNNQIKFQDYKDGLTQSYQTYKYEQFSKDIPIKNNIDTRKTKI